MAAVASEGAGEARHSRRSWSSAKCSCCAPRTPGATSPSSPPRGRSCGWPAPRSQPQRDAARHHLQVCIFYSGGWILVMKVVPAFFLYRGLHELGQYAFSGNSMGASRKEGIPTVSCGILSQNLLLPSEGVLLDHAGYKVSR
ncbi:hypothetical protein VPH35_099338 [Triticum aestivum]